MKRLKLIWLLVCMLCAPMFVDAQQEAMNAQYVTNMLAFNPAYAGYKLRQAVTIDHRNQWVGFKGAPSTTNISFDVASKRHQGMAYGANIIHDKIGPTSEMSLQGIVAYGVRLNSRSMLTVGIRSEASMFQADFVGLDITSEVFDIADVNFSFNPSKVLLANFGVGALYTAETFYVGLSTPRFLRNKLDGRNPDFQAYNDLRGKSEPTYYLMGGYSKKLTHAMEIQPSLLVRGTIGAPLSIGFYTTVILKDRFKVGGFYSYGEVFGGLFYFKVNKKTEFGYSFDVSANSLIRTNFGSHEVTMTYNFRKINRKIVYPRRF